MNILLTGAFGNIGISTLKALAGRGHRIRCFDLPCRTNRRLALKHASHMEVVWGDVRQNQDLQRAVQDQDLVIHLAALIPELSHTGQNSEQHPELAQAVNVGGMVNLLQAVHAMPKPAAILFTSTLHVYGRTQHLPPPRNIHCAVNPVELYAQQKVICEQLLRDSGLQWAVFRLAAAIPVRLVFSPAMFQVPLHNRIEFVHTLDVGVALANAVDQDVLWGKLWLIGGGARCQLTYGDMLNQVMALMGQAPLPAKIFSPVDYSVDWLDTAQGQQLLNYQQRTYADYVSDLKTMLGARLYGIRLGRIPIRLALWLLSVVAKRR
jgi:nucleoside-diphosphate-sugar epimerase